MSYFLLVASISIEQPIGVRYTEELFFFSCYLLVSSTKYIVIVVALCVLCIDRCFARISETIPVLFVPGPVDVGPSPTPASIGEGALYLLTFPSMNMYIFIYVCVNIYINTYMYVSTRRNR